MSQTCNDSKGRSRAEFLAISKPIWPRRRLNSLINLSLKGKNTLVIRQSLKKENPFEKDSSWQTSFQTLQLFEPGELRDLCNNGWRHDVLWGLADSRCCTSSPLSFITKVLQGRGDRYQGVSFEIAQEWLTKQQIWGEH